MKLRNFRLFLALVMPLLFILSFVGWNLQNQPRPAYSFTVKILPLPIEDDRADGLFEESYYWFAKKHLFPQTEIPEPLPKGIPTSDGFIYVSLEKNGDIQINSQKFGSVGNLITLTNKLREIFNERETKGIFEPKSNKTLKVVIVKALRANKYGDVVKLIDAVKSSGADPIILQIDDLPE